MKIAICIAAIAALVGTCTNSGSTVVMTDQTIEYQIEGNKYVVVVVQDEGISASQARKYARQRAAEITVENGGRYFTIDSEQETQVIRSDQDWPNNQAFYGNMYQELIIEGDFNRQRLQQRSVPTENMYPAYRLAFQIYPDKPNHKAIDACTLTDCNK